MDKESNTSGDNNRLILDRNIIKENELKIQQKNEYNKRYLIAILSGATIMGVYYSFDQPVPIHDNVRDRFQEKLGVNDDEFEIYYNILYGSFSWPNIILPFFSGFIADKIGCRKVLLFLTSCALLGSTTFFLGYYYILFGVMIAGRATIGICLGGYLSVIMSMLLGLANSMDSLNVSVTPVLLSNNSTSSSGQEQVNYLPFYIPIIAAGFSFFASLILIIFDKRVENIIKSNKSNIVQNKQQPIEQDDAEMNNEQENEIESLPSLSSQEYNDKQQILNNQNNNEQQNINKNNNGIRKLLMNVKELPRLYWLIFCYTVLSLWSILPFFGYSTSIFSDNQYKNDSDSNEKSSLAASFLWYLVLPFGTTIGFLLDKYGHRSKASFIAGLLSGTANLLVFSVNPYIPIIMMSISFSTFMSSYWSQVSMIVKKEIGGSAYGIINTGKFGGLAALTAIFGVMRSSFGSYLYSQIVLAIFGFTTSLIAILIFIYDKKYNHGKLELPRQKNISNNNNNNNS